MGPIKFRQQRLGGFALCVGLIVLAFAVFNWGLQYKRSLYQDSNAVRNAPAKLWTGRTLTAASTTAAVTPEHRQAVFLFLIVVVSLSTVPESRPRRGVVPSKLHLQATLRAFSVRPPPALATNLNS
jgi:hypothetical protein